MGDLQTAIELAVKAHAGVRRKNPPGLPYITHPLLVMDAVDGCAAKMVAVLHDVLEDSDLTAGDLHRAGFSQQVVDGVLAVTRNAGESYADFVVRCKRNPIGRIVKLADLAANFNFPHTLLRAASLPGDLARLGRYVLSYQFLRDELCEEDCRGAISQIDRMLARPATSQG
jgi:hypothetical protein